MSAVLKPGANVLSFPETLDDLVHQYVNAKQAEEGAKKIRLDLEDRILALAPALEEGSSTVKLDNGFKLTTAGSMNYKCDDLPALIAFSRACNVPDNLIPVKTKTELDSTGAKWIRQNDPDIWRIFAQFITVKPAKTSLKVSV